MVHPMQTLIIAEAGVNHNGDPALALALIDAAADAGADVVKFQTFRTNEVVTRSARQADYQTTNTGVAETQMEMIRRLELSPRQHYDLVERARQRNLTFLSTPFDLFSLDFLVRDLGLPCIKLPSGEVTNGPLLLNTARHGVDIILSTGMCRLGEVEDALGVLAFGYLGGSESPGRDAFAAAYASPEGQEALRRHVTLLHCTTEYPSAYADVNLRAMDTLGQAFGLRVGLSDHTPGIAIPIAAAARGATVLEKHFTLDRNLPGPDHLASLEPGELAALVAGVRQVEAALGNGVKLPTAGELGNREVARRSLVARHAIAAGEVFSVDNLGAKRPAGGLSPMLYWEMLGQAAERDIDEDEQV